MKNVEQEFMIGYPVERFSDLVNSKLHDGWRIVCMTNTHPFGTYSPTIVVVLEREVEE